MPTKKKNKLSALLAKKGIPVAKKEIIRPDDEEVLADLEQTRIELVKKHGEGSVIYASELLNTAYERLSTGNFALDVATGGGIPIGRVISCSGEYSVGKSLVLYHTIACAQARGLRCQLADVEGSYDADWGEICGINNKLLLVTQPGGAEEALQIAIDSQRRKIDFIGIDSVEALEPTKEMQHEFEDSMQMGIKQKMLGEYLRKFTALNNLRKRYGEMPLTLFLINQLRERPTMFGDPQYEPGGRALGFYSSIMMRLRIGEMKYYKGKKTNGIIIGNDVNFKIHKNKTFRRAQSGTYTVYTDKGGTVGPGQFDNIQSTILEGIAWRVIETKAQGSYMFHGEKIRGKDNLVEFLRENEDAVATIKEEIIEKLSADKTNVEMGGAEEDV